MNFAAIIPRKPFDKFRNNALSSVPPVKERRNDDKSHVTASDRRPELRLSGDSLDRGQNREGPHLWWSEALIFHRGAQISVDPDMCFYHPALTAKIESSLASALAKDGSKRGIIEKA